MRKTIFIATALVLLFTVETQSSEMFSKLKKITQLEKKLSVENNFTFKKPLEHIIKGDIDGKYMFSSEHKYLVAKISPTECYLEVKGIFEGKMDGCFGFGRVA